MAWWSSKPAGTDDVVTALTTYVKENFDFLKDKSLFRRKCPGLTGDPTSPPDSIAVGVFRAASFTPSDDEIAYDYFRLNPFTSSNTLKIYVSYNASTSNAGTFIIKIDIKAVADGEDASSTTYDATESTTVTPGSNVNLDQQLVATFTSSDVDLIENDMICVKIQVTSSSTHTGNCQIIGLFYEEVEV